MIIDVAANFEVETRLRGGLLLAVTDSGRCTCLLNFEGGLICLDRTRGVGLNAKVAGERRSNSRGTSLWIDLQMLSKRLEQSELYLVYLIIDQAPLLEESVDAHNGAYISSQVTSTSSDRKVFLRIEPVSIDHKVPVVFVHGRRLAPIATVEEFGKSLFLNVRNLMHIKPGTVAR